MNKRPTKTPMPHQDPLVRARNFEEVATGYTREMALDEADRCLNCKNKPCVAGCPVAVDIPSFIAELKNDNADAALGIIKNTSSLPAICGRVCPQESQCEKFCVRGIQGEPVAIGRLERYAADNGVVGKMESKASTGKRVAVIGSGPAGLTCAGALVKYGHSVTVFEAFHTPGGVLVYGIPEFRLPKSIVSSEISALVEQGVDIQLDSVVGRTLSVDDLFADGYNAVFIASGAGLPSFLGIKGEGAIGVYSANEFLTRTNLMKAYLDSYDTPINAGKNVSVIGGGNVAMDAARCALRLGAETVSIVYRRSEKELPARAEEVEHAKEEGIVFRTLTNPTEIVEDESGLVVGMKCVRMELGEPDASGRRSPVVIPDSEFFMDTDTVIVALGTTPNPLIRSTTDGLETDRRGCIIADEHMRTTRKGVWAGGDAVTGAATVILAMGAGRTAAEDINSYLIGE